MTVIGEVASELKWVVGWVVLVGMLLVVPSFVGLVWGDGDLLTASLSGFGVSWQPTPSMDPWLLTEGDLDWQRVVSNWMEKPGFGALGWRLVVTLVGIGVIKFQISNAKFQNMLKQLFSRINRLDWLGWGKGVSGTVRISARAGVIYMSEVGKVVVEGLEEYGMVVGNVKFQMLNVK